MKSLIREINGNLDNCFAINSLFRRNNPKANTVTSVDK